MELAPVLAVGRTGDGGDWRGGTLTVSAANGLAVQAVDDTWGLYGKLMESP